MIRTVLLLVRDLLHFVALACSSHRRLVAENLFLRKQLAFYVDRKVKPRRLNDATRIALTLLAGGGTGRDFACSGGGSHGALAVPGFRFISNT